MKNLPSVKPGDGACGAWWSSLAHFDYLHRCTLPRLHDGLCRCECGKRPNTRGVVYPVGHPNRTIRHEEES